MTRESPAQRASVGPRHGNRRAAPRRASHWVSSSSGGQSAGRIPSAASNWAQSAASADAEATSRATRYSWCRLSPVTSSTTSEWFDRSRVTVHHPMECRRPSHHGATACLPNSIRLRSSWPFHGASTMGMACRRDRGGEIETDVYSTHRVLAMVRAPPARGQCQQVEVGSTVDETAGRSG